MVDTATGKHLESNSGMAAKAIMQALERASLEADQIDLLVVSTASPDYLLPAMVTYVQDKLGLQRCATVELRGGCAAAVNAMDVARLYLERGAFKRAVVVGADAISTVLVPMFLGKDPDSLRMRDRVILYSFGDGAGAVVMEASDEAPGILGSAFACIGGGKPAAMQIVGGGTHAPLREQMAKQRWISLQLDVVEAARFAPTVLAESLSATLEKSGVPAAAIDMCIIPEGNAGYVLQELRASGLSSPEWEAFQDKIVENLALVGATGSAAVPLALDHAWTTGRLKAGDGVMLVGVETSKWLYSGMVLTWTAAAPRVLNAPASIQAASR